MKSSPSSETSAGSDSVKPGNLGDAQSHRSLFSLLLEIESRLRAEARRDSSADPRRPGQCKNLKQLRNGRRQRWGRGERSANAPGHPTHRPTRRCLKPLLHENLTADRMRSLLARNECHVCFWTFPTLQACRPHLNSFCRIRPCRARLKEERCVSSPAARFLKEDAPYLFQFREMGADVENAMDRWLWDLLNENQAMNYQNNREKEGGIK